MMKNYKGIKIEIKPTGDQIEKINKTIVIYPYQKGINDILFKGIDTIFYNIKDVPIKLEKIFNNPNHIENVADYLQELEV